MDTWDLWQDDAPLVESPPRAADARTSVRNADNPLEAWRKHFERWGVMRQSDRVRRPCPIRKHWRLVVPILIRGQGRMYAAFIPALLAS